ncbi:lysylphosphatidylglycerol synthase transmembrane domain-containing protein [Roseibium litorale]|uniref:Flippase-like domain-containing protein n=1 Tax=Roseibium litorale TaxID=2803841 RepID=A0ABR9CLE7_9HYPH|nr:lysylphosphatidylglycerol synthase transmembrane domain-containing protein [Roseibium litorale]MBD8891235.1 flippase-like domain-containing protein [Roseibium litorale]
MKVAGLPILSILSVVFCCCILILVLVFAGPAGILDNFSHVSSGFLIAGLVLVQTQIWLSAVRWRFTAARLGQELPLGRALGEYYVSSALNLVLPGGVAGDALRAYRVRTDTPGGWKRPASAVVLERASGQLAFFLLAGSGLIAWPVFLAGRLPVEFRPLLAGFWVVAGLLALIGAALFRWVLLPRYQTIAQDLAEVFWRKGAFFVQFGLSALIVASYAATFLLASEAVGAPLPPLAAVTIVPLCLLSMVLPVSVGGWGTREAAAAALWPLFGLTAAQGVSASLLYGALCLVGAAVPAAAIALWSFARRGPGSRKI